MLRLFSFTFGSYRSILKRSVSISSRSATGLASRDGELRIFIVAGEVSGDTIGSRFMDSLTKLSPFPVRFAGVGGLMMSKQGLSSLFPMEDISVMGIWELLPHLRSLKAKLKRTLDAALSFRPHVVLTVDSKGFSFRFLKQLRSRYVQLGAVSPQHFHYVAPSFWAWKGGEERLKGVSYFVDHMLCILPFEVEVCKSNGMDATFVGHPTLEDVLDFEGANTSGSGVKIRGNGEKFKDDHGISSGSTVITVLPGSRLQEVNRMLPLFADTMKLLKDSFHDLMTVVHVAPNQQVEEYISRNICEWPVPIVSVPGGSSSLKYNAFSASQIALCTSGTIAMELQLARLPCVVTYRAHFLTEWIIRYKAKVSYMSLPNILLNSAVIPEALFQDCTPSNLARLVSELSNSEELREQQTMAARKVLEMLTPPKAMYGESMQLENSHSSSHPRPSMIAASSVLSAVL